MKIGIITFHFPYNCGAMLQCAALQTALEKKGHEVEVIDYRPWYHQNRYTPRKNPMVFAKSCYAGKEGNAFRKFLSGCRGYGRIVLSWKDAGKKKDQDSRFKNFRVKHLHTGKVYRNIEALKKQMHSYLEFILSMPSIEVKADEKKYDMNFFNRFDNDWSDDPRDSHEIAAELHDARVNERPEIGAW